VRPRVGCSAATTRIADVAILFGPYTEKRNF